MGRIVHTTDSIGRRGVAQGEICKTCPGGCKTDLRAGVRIEHTQRIGGYDFSISFAEMDTSEFVDPLDDFYSIIFYYRCCRIISAAEGTDRFTVGSVPV